MASSPLITPHLARRLTARAHYALASVLEGSNRQGISSQALLFALSGTPGSLAQHALLAHRIRVPKRAAASAQNPDELKGVLKKAAHAALKHHQQFIGTEHLLYGVIDKARDISLTPTQRKKVKRYLEELFESTSSFGDFGTNGSAKKTLRARASKAAQQPSRNTSGIRINVKQPSATPTLDRFCDNLSEQAARGRLDPLVGRDAELDRLTRILTRRTKNNPLLVGEPGVGKSALVSGLAQRIEAGNIPSSLAYKRIYALNLNTLIAGTTFRGEFEERMRDLAEEASRDDVLLFIDEIHTLVGAGAAQGSLDAANILKPALVTGRFQCIGATTFEEFKKSIEKDGALDRRFQKLIVREETPQESKATLLRLLPLYERHHHVRISDDIASLCVDLAVRYLPQRTLPDKALDILDEACSKTVAEAATNVDTQRIHRLQQQIGDIIREKTAATRSEHYAKASRLKQEQELLEAELVEEEMPELGAPPQVTQQQVRHVVAEIASIPLASVRGGGSHDSLSQRLAEAVVGQDQAVSLLAQAVGRAATDVRDENRPVGSFLFVGPSGVGKTLAAKTLAQLLRGDSASFIKLDMSEFSESHTVSRLIGAPAGYVGYEDAGFLTDRIRRNPASIVLFDEIEKAHPRIFNILLQILEDGVLTDAQGRSANFKHAIIILTSNASTGEAGGQLGFSAGTKGNSEELRKELARHFRPEILNRIDEVIAFEALTKEHLRAIANQQLNALVRRLEQTIQVTISPRVAPYLAEQATSSPQGARAIRTLITAAIENPLSSALTHGAPTRARIAATKNGISVSCS